MSVCEQTLASCFCCTEVCCLKAKMASTATSLSCCCQTRAKQPRRRRPWRNGTSVLSLMRGTSLTPVIVAQSLESIVIIINIVSIHPERFEYTLPADELRFRRLSVSVKNNSASFRSPDVIGQVCVCDIALLASPSQQMLMLNKLSKSLQYCESLARSLELAWN